MSPVLRIDAPAPFFLGQQAGPFKATATDPDGDTVILSWAYVPGSCQETAEPSSGWTPATELTVQPKDTMAVFCVWAKASDQYGATSFDHVEGDPQDHAPVAALALLSPADAPPFNVNTAFVLTADASSDPDPGDSIKTYDWSLKAAPSTSSGLAPCTSDPAPSHQCLTADVAGDYLVEVSVKDLEGQAATADKWLHVVPGALGTPAIDLVSPAGAGPYPLGSLFQVSGKNSDGDGLELIWTYDPPAGAAPSSAPCNDQSSQCFTADAPGTYRIGLAVKNEAGKSPVTWATYVVAPDQPPCIEHTTPDFTSKTIMTMDTSLVVDLVFDDLDPYPSTADMQWWESDNGGDFRLVESDFPSLPLHYASYIPGDQLRVRLEVRDRDTKRSDDAFAACGGADVCTEPNLIHPDACFQRVTWAVTVE